MKAIQTILAAVAITATIVLLARSTQLPPTKQPNLPPNTTLTRHLSSPHTQIQILKSATSPLSPSLVRIQILSPKNPRAYQYSVVVLGADTYTGVAALISEASRSRPFPPLLFEWKPVFDGEFQILVHEIEIEAESAEETRPFDRLGITVEKQDESFDAVDSLRERIKGATVPCSSLEKADAYSAWDGDWLGPGLGLQGNGKLRNGWMFLPSETMNCTIQSYSRKDLARVPDETSVYVFGTSRERGVFLSLLDILLSGEEKRYLESSVIGKCWGRAEVRKGNVKLLYQDFRVVNFEPPGSTRMMECHNDKVSKLGDSLFVENALEVWEEMFQVDEEWPSVVYMLTNDGPNYDFEYHTKSFVTQLPSNWNGTLVFSDYSFTAKHPNMEYIEKHNTYRSDLMAKLNMLNDTRVRWLDGFGISKEMRLHGEWGEDHIAQSQHFHHFCNSTYVDSESNVQTMNVCSNITEMIANLLLGHALGSKEMLDTKMKDSPSEEGSANTVLRYCHSCPRRLLPFHIDPYPDMTCESGPFHNRTDTDPLVSICSKSSSVDIETCPEACMQKKVSWTFDSQSDRVNVRECPVSALGNMHGKSDIDEDVDSSVSIAKNDDGSIPPWLQSNLADVSPECRESDLPFFWLIPESGGTAVQNLYWCLGLTIANDVGANPKFGYDAETKLVRFLPFHGREWPVVNVDMSTREGILHAKQLGLTTSTRPAVQLVVSSHLRFAAEELFNTTHKGKVFAIFRNPIDREVSLLRHKQKSDPSFKLSNLTIDNWMVRNLVGKEESQDALTTEDLEVAKDIVRTKIIVGLESRFVKSIDRFNDYLGIKIHTRLTRGNCVREYSKSKKEANANQDNANRDELETIAKMNSFDVLLYEYAEGLFNEQDLVSGVDFGDSS